jgi:hypothetical protein
MSYTAHDLVRRLERIKRCESRSYSRGWWHGAFSMLALLYVLLLFVTIGGAP